MRHLRKILRWAAIILGAVLALGVVLFVAPGDPAVKGGLVIAGAAALLIWRAWGRSRVHPDTRARLLRWALVGSIVAAVVFGVVDTGRTVGRWFEKDKPAAAAPVEADPAAGAVRYAVGSFHESRGVWPVARRVAPVGDRYWRVTVQDGELCWEGGVGINASVYLAGEGWAPIPCPPVAAAATIGGEPLDRQDPLYDQVVAFMDDYLAGLDVSLRTAPAHRIEPLPAAVDADVTGVGVLSRGDDNADLWVTAEGDIGVRLGMARRDDRWEAVTLTGGPRVNFDASPHQITTTTAPGTLATSTTTSGSTTSTTKSGRPAGE